MRNFTSFDDVENLEQLISEALKLKKDPLLFNTLGKNKTIGLIFMNPSLRTRLSTQKAAMNLGLNVIVLNAGQESWLWEFEDGAVMNGSKVEHIKDAASIISQYCDIIGIRCFPTLNNRDADYNELVLNQFIKYSKVPVISLESATRHPLQSLADLITISENRKHLHRPRVVLTWAPHIKALPQAVANSFSEWMCNADVDLVVTHPEGFELKEKFTRGAEIILNQQDALKDADFVYVKNWSSYSEYGKVLSQNNEAWFLSHDKMKVTNNARIMHCLPVRRNVELCDELLDGENSLILEQSYNRLFAAQAVIKNILENN